MESLELLINTIQTEQVNDSFKMILASKINELMLTDFSALVQLLYRIDISEKKLKEVLESHQSEEAANVIAGLVIERQLEKLRLRKQYGIKNDIPEDDRW
jgi:hypothetical protein